MNVLSVVYCFFLMFVGYTQVSQNFDRDEGMSDSVEVTEFEELMAGIEPDPEPTWYESILNNILFWIGILLPFLILGVFAYSVKKKMKDRERRNRSSKT